jgi:TatA/E family protein of Tat protein translocase
MPMLTPWELIVVLIILVVVFGAGRLSQIGGALGKSVREFRSAVHENAPASPPASAAGVVAAPEALPVHADIACPSCQATNTAGQKFCGKCGTRLTNLVSANGPTAVENTCPSCATVNPPTQAFCGQCGTRLTRAAVA